VLAWILGLLLNGCDLVSSEDSCFDALFRVLDDVLVKLDPVILEDHDDR
jgi:hypothetical protein